ncbi:MAG: hypothetical protein CSYNP_04004 [Syntrophus sp. SKADARSKE-3]|nr:hypothetical protein [Syntrophus sp. SKADARSKE-3]
MRRIASILGMLFLTAGFAQAQDPNNIEQQRQMLERMKKSALSGANLSAQAQMPPGIQAAPAGGLYGSDPTLPTKSTQATGIKPDTGAPQMPASLPGQSFQNPKAANFKSPGLMKQGMQKEGQKSGGFAGSPVPCNTLPMKSQRESFETIQRMVDDIKIVTVKPEILTAIKLSRKDVNRITCVSEIKDIIYSKEKGLMVQFSGKDAFVKFKITKKGNDYDYASVPTEMFLVCGDNTYNVIAVPESIPSQTIRMTTGDMERIKKNQSIFSGMPMEKKVLSFVKYVYTGDIPESFTTTRSTEILELFRDVQVALYQTVSADGEGMRVKEYRIRIDPSSDLKKLSLDERDFMNEKVTTSPLGISMDKPQIEQGETARVFICEQTKDPVNSMLGKNRE